MLPTICAMCPQKIITRAKVPLKCNFANKSALFPQAAPCPFSILGRTLVIINLTRLHLQPTHEKISQIVRWRHQRSDIISALIDDGYMRHWQLTNITHEKFRTSRVTACAFICYINMHCHVGQLYKLYYTVSM